LKERGAAKFWQQLQGSIDSLNFEFQHLETEEAGIADEVAAGIIQYLGFHQQKVKALSLMGDWRRNSNQKLTHLPTSIGQLTSLQRLELNNNQLATLPEELYVRQQQGLAMGLSGNPLLQQTNLIPLQEPVVFFD